MELDVVYQPKMLVEMVLAIEGPFVRRLSLAQAIVMRLQMVIVGVWSHAEHAPADTVHKDSTAFGGASPFIQGEMERLLVPLPVILGRERVRTECTLEDPGAPGLLRREGVHKSRRPATATAILPLH